jgi:FixJ family two-component response regulator
MEPAEPRARTRATPEKQRAMVEMILQGVVNPDNEIATDTGVSPATVRLYRAVYRTLRDNPMADIGPKFQGRSVNAELVNVIRDAANRERAL